MLGRILDHRARGVLTAAGSASPASAAVAGFFLHSAGADNSFAHVSGLMVPAARARGTFDDDTLTVGPLPLGDDDRPCCDWPISP